MGNKLFSVKRTRIALAVWIVGVLGRSALFSRSLIWEAEFVGLVAMVAWTYFGLSLLFEPDNSDKAYSILQRITGILMLASGLVLFLGMAYDLFAHL